MNLIKFNLTFINNNLIKYNEVDGISLVELGGINNINKIIRNVK